MSLVSPSLGDILDRLSILSMKIQEGARIGRPIVHFGEEAHLLRGLLRKKLVELTEHAATVHLDELLDAVVALGAANGQLWELNARGRLDGEVSLSTAILLNDRRVDLVGRLDEIAGGKAVPPEKVYP